jgi:hypothetical protein
MGKIRAFLKLRQNKNSVKITRVSDLIKRGIDTEWLSDEFVRLNREVWGDITDGRHLWTKKMVKSHFRICPQIQYCAFENGKLVATLTNMFTTKEDMRKNKTWLGKTGKGFLTTHRQDGEIGFGVDLSVSKGVSKKVSDRIILSAIFIGVLGNGLKGVYLGSRIPGYQKNHQVPVEKYVFGKRKNGKPLDPELYLYLRNGFEIVEIIPNYMEDHESLNYGVLIRWNNPLYKVTKMLPFLKPVMRFVGRGMLMKTPKEIETSWR